MCMRTAKFAYGCYATCEYSALAFNLDLWFLRDPPLPLHPEQLTLLLVQRATHQATSTFTAIHIDSFTTKGLLALLHIAQAYIDSTPIAHIA